MNKEEIQKLIGGYATGSLTDDERRQLFEAALDDQELFDTLHGEQALKELLDDPISREQIRRAASESLPQAKASAKASWPRRPWIWAAGASVATAAMLLVVLVQWNREPTAGKQFAVVRKEAPAAPPREERSAPKIEAEPSVKAPQPAGRRMAAKKEGRPAESIIAAAPIPAPPQAPPEQAKLAEKDVVLAPPPPVSVQTETQSQAPGHQRAAATPFAPQAQDKNSQVGEMQRSPQAFRTQAIGAAGLTPQPAPRSTPSHFFARRQEDGSYVNVPADTVFHPGEAIRLTIVPGVSGPLLVSEWDATASSWNRLFPAEGETVRVRALQRYTVPIDIVVKSGERLRVTVASGAAEIPVEVR